MATEITVRQFMLKKFPTDEWMDCPIPKHHWDTIQEYADQYSQQRSKELESALEKIERLTVRCGDHENGEIHSIAQTALSNHQNKGV